MATDSVSALGANLKRFRDAKNLTQHELAELSGVSRATIATLETGSRTSAETKTIEKLASALGESVASFFIDAPDRPQPS